MAYLSIININGIAVAVSPEIEIVGGAEAAITAFIESIFGGAFTGLVTVTINDSYPNPLLGITVDGSPYSIESIVTSAPVNTYEFTQSDCGETAFVPRTCLSDTLMNALVLSLKKAFPTCCGQGTVSTGTGEVIPVDTIYFGNSLLAALNEAEILALSTTDQIGYEGAFAFGATVPSEYKHIAIKTSLGVPVRFYDPVTTLDIPMAPSYSVTVNTVAYTVYRTFYQSGGAQIITII